MLNQSDRKCGNLLCGNMLTELETQYCIQCMREEASENPPLRRFMKGNKKGVLGLLKESSQDESQLAEDDAPLLPDTTAEDREYGLKGRKEE